jgi:phosphohistidine phosphatase
VAAGPYELYLIRHAVAEERGDDWPDDAKRPLSEDGASRMRKNARGLDRLGVTLDVIVTSPFVRAKQTAEIVAAALNPKPPIVTADSLAPGGTYQAITADLEKQSKRTHIAIVGHEPGIGELAARLIGSRHSFEFKKGGACRIDVDQLPPSGPGDLIWSVTPKILRSLKR